MSITLPLNVGLMDDDYFALKWNSDLLTKDLRTTVSFETESPYELLDELAHCEKIDLLLLDVEYFPKNPNLDDLLNSIDKIKPNLPVVCLSQYGGWDTVSTAILHGTRGFLLKNEIKLEIASALILALQVRFLVTPGILPLLINWDKSFLSQTTTIPVWLLNPKLTSKLNKIFTFRVLYGMSAPLTAQEVFLSPGTIEKYMQQIYQKLSLEWGDTSLLTGVNLEKVSPETQAFHFYVLPPKSKPSGN
jgi:DNA-binding NarL/FixJ family response regulator